MNMTNKSVVEDTEDPLAWNETLLKYLIITTFSTIFFPVILFIAILFKLILEKSN